MNDTNWERFFTLRKRVFDAIKKIVEDPEDDGHHKSYEGAMDVTFSYGDYFTSSDEKDLDGVIIKLHCYLLIDGRHEEWWGKTFEEALDKATVGINHILEADGFEED